MKTKGIDLTKCKGLGFKANIRRQSCEGRIQVENGLVYLCQNKKDGWDCKDKIGFKYSWLIGNGLENDLRRNNVSDFEIVPRDPGTYQDWQVGDKVMMKYIGWNEQVEVIFRSGELVVCKDSDKNATETKTCEQLYREGGRLVLTDIEKQLIEERKKSEWEPQDGDIIAFGYKAIGIFRNFEQSGLHSDYVTLSADNLSFNEGGWILDELRPATEEEKQKLFDAMKKNGKQWNAEKKVVEDILKPYEFKKGEPVLVRDGDKEIWRLRVYIGSIEGSKYTTYLVKSEVIDSKYRYCIPYNERTMHLLGTTEDYKEGE